MRKERDQAQQQSSPNKTPGLTVGEPCQPWELAMNSLIRCAAALVFTGALAGVCQAQDQPQGENQPSGRGAVRAACQADIAKLCSADADGHGAFRCLREHQDALSDSCKSAMSTARAQRRDHGGGQGAPESSPSAAPQT
jgi:hypothetical protein